MARQLLACQDLVTVESSRSHVGTPHSVGLLWTSDQPDAEISTWKHTSQETNIHAPGGIRTRSPSKRAAADLLLTLRDHWDRQRNISRWQIVRSNDPGQDEAERRINWTTKSKGNEHCFAQNWLICMLFNRAASIITFGW